MMILRRWFYDQTANAITLVNLICGICAIILIMDNQIELACYFILIGMIADGIDGKVAYLLRTTSHLGKQLDSLCDVISFGLAPSLLIYRHDLIDVGIAGVLITCLFVISSVIRLARYNLTNSQDYFSGLPITIAGGFLISVVLMNVGINHQIISVIMILLSILMVSSIPYSNLKSLFQSLNIKLIALILLLNILGCIFLKEMWLIILLFIYIVQGIIIATYHKMIIKFTSSKRYRC